MTIIQSPSELYKNSLLPERGKTRFLKLDHEIVLTWRETNHRHEELKAGIDTDKEERLLCDENNVR